MCSLKLFVTIYFVYSFHRRALALTTTSGSRNLNEHTQPAGTTSVQPEEIHSLFSNETLGHTSANSTAINDKVSVSSIKDSVPKTASQDIISTKIEAQTSVTPTLPTSSSSSVAGLASTSSSKLNAGPIPDQHVSIERVTPNGEFPLEGGGTVANVHSSTPEDAASKVNITSVQSSESLPLENIYSDTEQNNKTSTVVARKGAEYKPSKIVPRKGVEPCSCSNVTNSENGTICCGSPNELNSGEEIDEKNVLSIQGVENATVTNSNNTTVMEQQTNTSTLISLTEVKKTKATKPLYTVDAANDNVGNISAVQTPTKKLEQGSNYVVPVVGTILMVPLIAVLSVLMYKKGCEFWERRHYRRMDFLIDGMYND